MPHVISLVEKVIATYVEAFVAALLLGSVIDVSTAQAAALAAIPAGLTVISSGMPLVPVGLPFYVDLGLRTIRTYAVSFIGFLVALPVFALDFGTLQAASAAAIPAALAVIKGALSTKIGNPTTAAALPARLDVAA